MSRIPWVITTLMALAALLASVPQVLAQRGAAGTVRPQAAVGAGFTYQGRLTDGGTPANGRYDMQFRLFDAAAAGQQVGGTITMAGDPGSAVVVDHGLFTVQLDFDPNLGLGNVFNGEARWIEVAVRPVGSGEYTVLAPREPVTPAPYAVHALTAGSALTATGAITATHALTATYATAAGNVPGAPRYRRTVLVSPVGTPVQNGAALLTALAGIGDAADDNRYLLKIEPGVFDIVTGTLQMRQYVDVEGSGELVTTITAAGRNDPTGATVRAADEAELRFLTVVNTGGVAVDYAIAMANVQAGPRVSHVTFKASEARIAYGVLSNYSRGSFTDVTVAATGSGPGSGVAGFESRGSVMSIANTKIHVVGGGTMMPGGVITGVNNLSNSFVDLNGVSIIAQGADYAIGVQLDSGASATLDHVNIAAFDASGVNAGVFVLVGTSRIDANIQHSSISATGYSGAQSIGIATWPNASLPTSTPSKITVTNSVVGGTTAAISNYTTGGGLLTGAAIRVGSSQLDPGISGSGVTCAATYNSIFTFFGSTCP